MNQNTFAQRVQLHRLRSQKIIEAARLVLIEGMSQVEASRLAGTTQGQLSPIVRRLQSDTCPYCGHKGE